MLWSAPTLCKGRATLNSTLSGEVGDPYVVFLTRDKVSLVESLCGFDDFVVSHLSQRRRTLL